MFRTPGFSILAQPAMVPSSSELNVTPTGKTTKPVQTFPSMGPEPPPPPPSLMTLFCCALWQRLYSEGHDEKTALGIIGSWTLGTRKGYSTHVL